MSQDGWMAYLSEGGRKSCDLENGSGLSGDLKARLKSRSEQRLASRSTWAATAHFGKTN